MKLVSGVLATCTALFLAVAAEAATVPFTENFASDSGWLDATGSPGLDFVASGGQDFGGFVSTTINFEPFALGDQGPVLFRGPGSASGGAFAGDWITEGIGELTAWVRHGSTVPLNFFARLARPFNFPGAIGVQFAPVIGIPGPAGWTQLSFAIDPSNPQFVSFEGQSFEAVFSNVGIVQLGVSVPEGLAGIDYDVLVELDTVGIAAATPEYEVPEADALFLLVLGLGLMALAHPRRRA